MDDAEARQILREHGEKPTERGTLSRSWRARAEELLASNGDGPGDDYDQGVSAADFVSAAADPPDEPAEPAEPGAAAAAASIPAAKREPGQREQRPRRVKRGGRERKSLADRVRSASSSSSAKPKKHHPRVRVDRLVSRGWDVLGGLAARVDPPVGRCLQMQAPVAGLILEDVVKGTFVDRALQPIARSEERAEKVLALVGPPLCVAGLEMAQQLPEPQRKAREAILLPLLVESLVLSERVAGAYADEVIARAAQDEPARERAARLVGVIFAVPTEGADTPSADREHAAAPA